MESGVIQSKKEKLSVSQRIKKEWKKNYIVYIFLVPILIHFVIFQLYPFAVSFFLTFMDWKVIGESKFVGLAHWKYLFKDPLAWKALWNTAKFSFYYILPTMAIGLLLAMLINSGIKGAKFFKAIFFLPVVTSFVVVAGIWAWLFGGTDAGLINFLIGKMGISNQLFLSNPSQALIVLAGLSIFKVCGNTMIYYYGGLQSIDRQIYEAADIDGASGFRKFWNITFPMLKPIHFYVLINTTIGSFQVFDSAYLLTSGGPNYSTTTIVYYLYQQGFANLNLSYASVISYVLLFIILTISLIQRKFLDTRD